jgi:hypothetical protein
VPTGRLELPRLSPLPPQDSVSTNFTTSASSGIRYQRSGNSKTACVGTILSVTCYLNSVTCHFGTSDGAEPLAPVVPLGLGVDAGAVAGAPGTSDGFAGSTRSMTPFSITPSGTPRCDPR